MSIKDYDELSTLELDALKEVGSIGTGNAATSLSELIGRKVRIKTPEVRIMGYTVGGRDESIGGIALEIDKAVIASVNIRAGAPSHDIRIDIHGIDRIGDGDFHILTEEFLDVAAVALRAVGNEDLVGGDVHPAILEVRFCDCLAEEAIALLGTVAVERLALCDVVDGLVHRLCHCGRQRLRDIADAETDDLCGWIFLLKTLHAVCDFGEKIAGLDFEVVFVDANHDVFPLK